jgi:hypothetical protein
MCFPVCLYGAKREDANPYEGKKRTGGYAKNMKAPFVVMSANFPLPDGA